MAGRGAELGSPAPWQRAGRGHGTVGSGGRAAAGTPGGGGVPKGRRVYRRVGCRRCPSELARTGARPPATVAERAGRDQTVPPGRLIKSCFRQKEWAPMAEDVVHTQLPGRLVMLGCGSIGQAVLPLILRHLGVTPDRITIVTADRRGSEEAAEYGIAFHETALTQENYRQVLEPF